MTLDASEVLMDIERVKSLIKKLQKPLTNPNWENESRLLDRSCEGLQKSLSRMRKALVPPKPA